MNQQRMGGVASERIADQIKELLGGRYEHPIHEAEPGENVEIFPIEPQKPTILITPPADALPNREEVPIHQPDPRDSIYITPVDSPIDLKTILIMYNKVKELEVGSYKDIRNRGEVGDRLEGDHIPSVAAVINALEKETGRLTPAQRNKIINSTHVIAISEELHRQSPTYGGKNRTLSQQDSGDLLKAAERDMASLRDKLLDRGHLKAEVDNALEKLDRMNREMGIYDIGKKGRGYGK